MLTLDRKIIGKHGQVHTLCLCKTERSLRQTWPGTYFMLKQDKNINAANIATYILYAYARQKDHCGKHGQVHTVCLCKTERSTRQTLSRTYFMLTQARKIISANMTRYKLYAKARQLDQRGKLLQIINKDHQQN